MGMLEILYKIKILKKKTTIDKIKKIKSNKKIDLYNSKFKNSKISILNSTIDVDIENISNVLKQDINNSEVIVPNVSSGQFKIANVCSWYTNSRELIEGLEQFTNWISISESLLLWYYEDNNTVIKNYNMRRLKPYIKHIETIIDEIYDILYGKKRK